MTFLRNLSMVLSLAVAMSVTALADDNKSKGTELAQLAQNTQPPSTQTVADGPGDLRLPDTASRLPAIAVVGLLAIGAD
jgi:hypothetical protein